RTSAQSSCGYISRLPGARRARPSFPTRRSSDLGRTEMHVVGGDDGHRLDAVRPLRFPRCHLLVAGVDAILGEPNIAPRLPRHLRSEEHTSELQSRENLVCRLLLEKKKKKDTHQQ